MKKPIVIAAVTCFLFSHCGLRHVDYDQSHIVPTDSFGYTYGDKQYWSKGNPVMAKCHLARRLQGLDQDFSKEKRVKEVMVFVHGGLTSQGAAIDHANKIKCALAQDGRTDIFPVFITWDSELFSTYGWHLRRDANGICDMDESTISDELRMIPRVPFLLVSDIGVGLGSSPRTFYNATAKALQNWDFFYNRRPQSFPTRQRYDGMLASMNDNPASSHVYHKGNGKYPFEMSAGRSTQTLESNASGVFTATLTPLAMGLSPVYESLGKPAWKNMLRRSKTLVHRSPTFIRDSNETRRADGVAMEVLRQIGEWQKDNPNLKVTFVGHSMGTIVLNEAFRAMEDERNLKDGIRLRVDKVLYLAAACSIRDFNDSVGRYMDRNTQCEVYSLCLHPKREVGEKFRPYLPLVYSGSLLTWIDEFFQNPVDFQERTFGSFENCVIAAHLLPQTKRFHLKAFEENESFMDRLRTESGPQKHGEMSDFRFWDPDFYNPVPHGHTPQYRSIHECKKSK